MTMPPSGLPFPAMCCFYTPTTATADDAEDPDPSSAINRDCSDRSSTPTSSSTSSLSATTTIPSKFSHFSSRSTPSIPACNFFSPTDPSSSCRFELLSSLNTYSSGAVIAVSPHPTSFLYIASGSEVCVHDLVGDLRRVEAFSTGGATVKALAFSADGSQLFTAHHDGRIRVWVVPTGAVRHRHRLAATLPTAVDRLLRFALPSSYVIVRRHHRRLWIQHADAVSALAVSGDLLYSASWDKSVKVWSGAGGFFCRESIAAHDDAVSSVAASGDGATIYTASADRRIRIWARSTLPHPKRGKRPEHELVATLERHRSAVNAVALSPDGSRFYSGGGDREIAVWRTVEGAPSRVTEAGELRGHDRAVMCLAAVGGIVVSGSTDRTVRIWQRVKEEHCCAAVLTGHREGVRSVSACRFGGGGGPAELEEPASAEYRVCSGSVDGEVRVWRVLISGEDKRGSDILEK